MTDKDQRDLIKAFRSSSASGIQRLLDEKPELVAYLRQLAKPDFANTNEHAYRIIPLIAQYYPDFVRETNVRGETALIRAAQGGHIHTMLALVKAGADIHFCANDNMNVFMCAAAHIAKMSDNVRQDYLFGLREMGFTLNEPTRDGYTLLQEAIGTGDRHYVRQLLLAGANLCKALHITPKPGKLYAEHLDEEVKACLKRFGGDENLAGGIVKLQRDVMEESGEDKLSFRRFFATSGKIHAPTYTLHKHVYQWEAFSLLAPMFAPDAGERWDGGVRAMLDVYHRLPPPMQQHANGAAIARDAPVPHATSVTVRYMRGKVPEKAL